MWRVLAAVLVITTTACQAPVAVQAAPNGEQIAFGAGGGGARDACFKCHGRAGEGSARAPGLAGQTAGYLVKQLDDYAGRWRNHPEMSGIAAGLGEGGRISVAAYYAGLARNDASFADRPKPTLWSEGDPVRGLRACADCHEQDRQGLANPNLAGLDVAYVSAQLSDWKAAKRRNDPRDIMGTIARALTDAEITALAAYVGGER